MMRACLRLLTGLCLVVCCVVWGTALAGEDGRPDGVLLQVGVLADLKLGDYRGRVGLHEAVLPEDQGIGTVEGLAGELIVLDGEAWLAGRDLKPVPAGNASTPFLQAMRFAPERSMVVAAANFGALVAEVESKLPDKRAVYAIRATGVFDALTLRSVDGREKPWKPLAHAVAAQTVGKREAVAATLVGFWFPEHLGEVGSAGLHVHGIDAAKSFAGHVLDASGSDLTLSIGRVGSMGLVFGD